jgi:hypothetical protein
VSIKQLVPLNLLASATAPTGVRAGELYYNTTNSTVYVYTGSAWITTSRANGFTTVTSTTPASPQTGDVWFDTTSNTMLVYNSGSWSGVVGVNASDSNPADLVSSWWLGS